MKPPFQFKKKLNLSADRGAHRRSERQLFIIGDLFEFGSIASLRGRGIRGSTVAFRYKGLCACRLLNSNGAFALCVNEECLVNDDLCSVMLYVVVVRPVSCLERTYNTYGACLAEISGYKFSILSPCRAAYKVRRALLTVLCAESAIDGNGKGSYRYTGRSRF